MPSSFKSGFVEKRRDDCLEQRRPLEKISLKDIHFGRDIIVAFGGGLLQVSKWGNSLAVRLPKKLVEELKLAPGDTLDVVDASKDKLAVEKIDRKARFLRDMERFNWSMPAGWRFDRDEANER